MRSNQRRAAAGHNKLHTQATCSTQEDFAAAWPSNSIFQTRPEPRLCEAESVEYPGPFNLMRYGVITARSRRTTKASPADPSPSFGGVFIQCVFSAVHDH